jgi:hypothetical protein
MTVVGDLVVIQDKQKFYHSLRSFHAKWATATVKSMKATEKETGKQIKLKYYGHSWKPFEQIVGIVTEITPEEHPDFDVIKIREQTGSVRYCRRFIVESARD